MLPLCPKLAESARVGSPSTDTSVTIGMRYGTASPRIEVPALCPRTIGTPDSPKTNCTGWTKLATGPRGAFRSCDVAARVGGQADDECIAEPRGGCQDPAPARQVLLPRDVAALLAFCARRPLWRELVWPWLSGHLRHLQQPLDAADQLATRASPSRRTLVSVLPSNSRRTSSSNDTTRVYRTAGI